jgi:hypothetical protein
MINTNPWSTTVIVKVFPSLIIEASMLPPGNEYFLAFITISRKTSWKTGGN